MKKLVTKTLLASLVLLLTFNSANATNYAYKVYNPVTKKLIHTKMAFLKVFDDSFMTYFYAVENGNAKPICVLSKIDKNPKEDGTIGGKCMEYYSFRKYLEGGSQPAEYSWREYKPNTFDEEIREIMQEAKEMGLKPAF